MLIIFCQDISSATDNKLFCNIDKNNVVLCFIFLKENILWIYALLFIFVPIVCAIWITCYSIPLCISQDQFLGIISDNLFSAYNIGSLNLFISVAWYFYEFFLAFLEQLCLDLPEIFCQKPELCSIASRISVDSEFYLHLECLVLARPMLPQHSPSQEATQMEMKPKCLNHEQLHLLGFSSTLAQLA